MHAVTNGVHPYAWTGEPSRRLYDRYLAGWCHEPKQLVRADCCISDAAVWGRPTSRRQILIEKERVLTGVVLHPKARILGFARRMTAYKRPDLLFTDLERLKSIARNCSLQIVVAGKTHPRDAGDKRLIEGLHRAMREPQGAIPMAFLPDYDLGTALAMVAGVDVWLYTPLPPLEASGTSGMTAAFNGVPNLSVLNGWWIEGCIEGITGWAIGGRDAPSDDDACSMTSSRTSCCRCGTARAAILPAGSRC